MTLRLTVVTLMIGLFGLAMSALAQHATEGGGNTLASLAGQDCHYQTGVVCQIERNHDFNAPQNRIW